MNPVLVQTVKATGNNYTNGYTANITLTAGNFVTIQFGCGAADTFTITDNKGNTFVIDAQIPQTGQRQVAVLHASNVTGGATTIQLAFASYIDSAVIIQEWSGMPASVAVNIVGSNTIGSGTTYSLGVTTSKAPVLMIGAIASTTKTPAFVADSAWSNLQTQGGFDAYTSVASQYRVGASAGAFNWTLTNSSGTQAAMTIVAYAAAVQVAPAKPVKVWTGSAWVSKPVKVWTGSAWVTKTMRVQP